MKALTLSQNGQVSLTLADSRARLLLLNVLDEIKTLTQRAQASTNVGIPDGRNT